MKLKSLLLFGGMLAVTSAQATLTVTERTLNLPDPASTAVTIDGNTVQYLYNVGTKSYFLGANDWETRASASTSEGFKVKVQSTGDNTVAIIDYVKKLNAWRKTFVADADGIWVDNDNGDNCDSWVITPGDGNNFTISNTAFEGSFLGALTGSDTRLYLRASDTENFQYTWYAVSETEYAANIEERKPVVAIYNASVPLWNALVEADALGVPGIDAYETIYGNEASTVEELNAALEGVKDAIKTFQAGQASAAEPKDMTSLIANPDFAENKGTGWSGTAFVFQTYADAEHYNKTYNTYQEITGMPVGVYALTSQAYYRAGWSDVSYQNFKAGKEKNAMLYAVNKVEGQEVLDTLSTPIVNVFYGIQPNNSLGGNESTVADGDDTYYVPNNMETAKTYFDAGYYKDNSVMFAVSEGTAVIGVRKDVTTGGDWSIFNNFGLTYYGNGEDAYQLWNDDIIKNLPTYNAEEMQVTTSVVGAFEEAKTNAAVGATYEAVKANIAALEAAQAAIDANIAAWQSYKDEISSAQLVANNPNYNGEDMDYLNDYLMTWPDMYLEEKTLTTDEIIAETSKLKGLREAAIANSISEGTDVTEWLKNTDFSNGQDGWTFKSAGGVATTNKNAKCAEAWNNPGFDIYQTVDNAPIGVYEISVQGFYRYGRGDDAWKAYFTTAGEKRDDAPASTAYVYMNDMKTPLANVFEYQVPVLESYYNGTDTPAYTDPNGEYIYPNGMQDAGLAFDNGQYKVSAFGLVAKKGDAMRVGVKGATNQLGDSWAIFTRFKLTYQGFKAEVVKPALETTIAGVDLTKVMGSDVKTKAQELITTANATLDGTDGKAMFDALAAIASYSETIDKSVTLFSSLSTKMQSVAEYVESSDAAEDVKADVAEYLGEVEANMAAYTDAQANEAIEKLEECRYKLALPAGYENATDAEPVNLTALVQTPSFEKDGANSIEGWEGTTGYNFGNDATQKAALAVEFYEKDFDMYQDIKVPANGMYQVTVRAFDRYVGTAEDYAQYAEGTKSLAELYAKTGENEVVKSIEHLASDVNASTEKIGIGNEASYNNNDEIEYFVPNDMVSAVAYFSDATAQRYLNGVNIRVTDGTLRIGIRQADHKTGCWVIMDDFQLWYLGADSQKEEGGFTDVKGVETVSEPVKVEIYSIDGIKRSAVQNGLNVVVTTDAYGNVTAKTVVVKK